jgi:hypothetical protein
MFTYLLTYDKEKERTANAQRRLAMSASHTREPRRGARAAQRDASLPAK